MSAPSEEKICFVIAPIGLEGTDTRKRSDQVFKHIIDPVVRARGYKAIRADHISTPGVITSQVIDHVLNAHLVVADLTGHNPNVFYELALRHIIRKPVVQMTNQGESLPFDVAGQRTIHFDCHDLDSVEAAKEELGRQIIAVEKDPTQVDSPVSMAVDLSALQQRSKPEDTTLLQAISLLQEIKLEQRDMHLQVAKILGEPGRTDSKRMPETGSIRIGTLKIPVRNIQSTQDDVFGDDGTFVFRPIKPMETPPEK